MKSIILAGGSGTRLFPLSRKGLPKQFLNIGSDKSLFQRTVERVLLGVKPEDVIIVTNKNYRFHIEEQLKSLDPSFVDFCHIILEPVGKNTTPAIILAAKFALEKIGSSEREVLFVCPSDHIISPDEKFLNYMKEAEKIAKEGYIVTFGVKPTRPETGYGYIEGDLEHPLEISGISLVYRVRKFHEKPELEIARKYLAGGHYYWNSGMFAFTIESLLKEVEKYAPEIYEKVEDKTFEEVLNNFESMPDISIDYAIMEKTDRAVVLPLEIEWSDVGSWDAVYEIMKKDARGNVKQGQIFDIDIKNCLVIGNNRLLSMIGVSDLIVVETDDVLLIAKRGESQKVKNIVNELKKNKKLRDLTEYHTTVYRPWGSYTELEKGERYKIKRITVKPGEALSLQLHYHRSEHWIVVKGTAKVVLEDKDGTLKEYFLHENESIYVPKTTKHRLINPGKVPLELIEVQVGEYVEEDDIVRFEDKYNR